MCIEVDSWEGRRKGGWEGMGREGHQIGIDFALVDGRWDFKVGCQVGVKWDVKRKNLGFWYVQEHIWL
jgi:hypothetical protein